MFLRHLSCSTEVSPVLQDSQESIAFGLAEECTLNLQISSLYYASLHKGCVLYNIFSFVGKSIHSQSFKNITIDGKTNSYHITNKFLCSGKFGANTWKKLVFSFEISHRRMRFCNYCLLYSFKFAFMSCVLIQKYIKARDTGRYYKQKFIGGQQSWWAMHTSGRFLGNVL